jgi:putative drug exporter of the RND superfamily
MSVGSDGSERSSLGRLARLVMRHRRRVMLAWVVCFAAGGFAASQLTHRLSYDFSLPGQPSFQTGAKIQALFGNGGNTTPGVLVITAPAGESIASEHSTIASAFSKAQAANPDVRVVDVINTGDTRFVTANGRTTYAFLFPPPDTSLGADPRITATEASVARALPGNQVGLTGIAALSAGGSSKGPSVLIETLLAGVAALAVLAFVFSSFLALLPLVIASVSILTTFLLLLGLSYVTTVSFIVQFLVSLVGLGVAIDYSLLFVTRWREERARGESNEDAIVQSMRTAGRAVLLSGLTVAIGLMSLIVLPVPFLRSTGLGGMLIPLVSVAVVLTLLPAILASVGPRWDWPRLRSERSASRGWTAWAKGITRHPWLGLMTAMLVLGIAISPVLHLRVGQTSAQAEAQSGAAHRLYGELLSGNVPAGVITPMEVLVTESHAIATMERLRKVSGVETVAVAEGAAGSRSGYADLVVVPDIETVNSSTLGPTRSVEAALADDSAVVGVSGEGPGQQAFTSAVYGNVPLMLVVLALLTFLLLARALRSIILALKAVVLNVVSLAATFGILTWFWQDGHGSSPIFGIPATGAVTFWVPITVFAFLFGLSMDYEVFILTRVREEYDNGHSTNEALVEGLGRTGRLVTSAALILFLAFISLASAPLTDVKILATGLGIGILLDATIIRALFVPSLVVLFGRRNWWFPRNFGRLLFVSPGGEHTVARDGGLVTASSNPGTGEHLPTSSPSRLD